MERPLIEKYSNWREFVRDYWNWLRAVRPSMSFRQFSKECGFGSHNYIAMLLDGRRNLTGRSAAQLALGFALSTEERAILLKLVCDAVVATYHHEFMEAV